MKTVYSFIPGRSFQGVSPQQAGEELERLRKEADGLLKAHDVLDAARDEHSPLHNAFEWDDTVAAESHRLNQARRLITSVSVFTPETAKPTPTYVNVRSAGGRGYMPTIEVLGDDELRTRALMEVQHAIDSIRRKYTGYVEICEILDGLKRKAS